MSATEKKQKLSPDEILQLKQKLRGFSITLLLVVAVFAGVLTFMIRGAEGIFLVFIGVFLLITIFVFTAIVKNALLPMIKDINNGVKLIISGIVENKNMEITKSGKNETTTTLSISIGEKIINVDAQIYNQITKGQQIELHLAPLSKHILKADLGLQNSATETQTTNKNEIKAQETRFNRTTKKLNFEEETLLKNERKRKLIRKLLRFVVISIFAIPLVVGIEFFLLYRFGISAKTLRMVIIADIAFVLLIIYRIIQNSNSKINLDLNEGRKLIFDTKIKNAVYSDVKITANNVRVTSSTGDFYYVEFDIFRIRVSKEDFEKLKTGETITVEITPNSEYVLNIKHNGKKIEMKHP